jgi:hypothetical protein
MIYWLTPHIALNDKFKKVIPGAILGTFQVKPSVAAQANSACDLVTDIVVASKTELPFDVLFFSDQSIEIKNYLGGVAIKRQHYFSVLDNPVAEHHDLHIPVYGSGEIKMVYGCLAVPVDSSPSDYKKLDDLMVKVGWLRS